jgi:hypothetical protein
MKSIIEIIPNTINGKTFSIVEQKFANPLLIFELLLLGVDCKSVNARRNEVMVIANSIDPLISIRVVGFFSPLFIL